MKKVLLFSIIALIISCQFNTPTGQNTKAETEQELDLSALTTQVQQGVAKEIQQSTNYTYILINSDGSDLWIAVPKMEASVGTKYYFIENMKMENFVSKQLNKTFESILFVQKISTSPDSFNESPKGQTPVKPEIVKQDIKIEKIEGGVTIAELYSNKSKYNGKTVTIRGVVTKYNEQIMGKNWVHLQDGTSNGSSFDLTVTTLASTSVGETLVFTGKITLDKDFGAGYKYEIIMEDAKIK